MPTITVFRSGSTLSLEPVPGAESITLLVHPEVAVRKSGLSGRSLLYRDPGPYGQTVTAAIELGWAQLPAVLTDNEPDEFLPASPRLADPPRAVGSPLAAASRETSGVR